MGYHFHGLCSLILASKLKALKSILKVGNREGFDNVSVEKEMAFNQMEFCDSKKIVSILSQEEVVPIRVAREEYCECHWKKFLEAKI